MPKDLLPDVANFSGLSQPGTSSLEDLMQKFEEGVVRARPLQVGEDGRTALVPNDPSGQMDDEQLMQQLMNTGHHFGIFTDREMAQQYYDNLAQKLGWNGAPERDQYE